MKYSEDRHFLYPVLLPDSDNYPSGVFRVANLEPIVELDRITLSLTFHLQEPSIQQAVEEGKAQCGAVLYCPPTLYRKLVNCPLGSNRLEVDIPRGQIHKGLEINPLVYARQEFRYQPHTAHAEYSGASWMLGAGYVLAQDETCNVKFPPPAFLQHFVSWRIDESLPDYEIRLDKDDSRFLYIQTNSSTRSHLYSLPDRSTKPSFYLGVLHDILSYVQLIKEQKELDDQRAEREWLDGFLNHLEFTDIDLDDLGAEGLLSPWQAAQKLLNHPYAMLETWENPP